jgi:hypothetical protein
MAPPAVVASTGAQLPAFVYLLDLAAARPGSAGQLVGLLRPLLEDGGKTKVVHDCAQVRGRMPPGWTAMACRSAFASYRKQPTPAAVMLKSLCLDLTRSLNDA